ncbi:MAG: hypothetical protein ACI4VE_06630, partial [Clostridia bacterium]
MSDNFKYSEWRKNENIKRYEIPNVEDYFEDLMNIEHSFSGRMDIPLANTFIMEAVQLVVNSIALFELGYFDNAYYSLREAIEISTTIVYLSDMPDEERQEKMEDWKNTKDFPMQGQMLNQLYQYGIVISDMKEKMESFFDEIKSVSKSINKCIHKQGLRFFYVSRNHPFNGKKDDNLFIKNYVYFLEKTVVIIAVMRLAIDPYPILLMDEEVLLRCFDSMTEPYKNEFVEKYITNETLEDYKKTEMYINHYNGHIVEEKKNYVIFDIMKHQVIDTTKREDILSQIYLLDNVDRMATYIALISKKVVKIYTYGGFQMYFTDRKTNRKALSWNGMEFKQFEESSEKFNQKYDEAFISVFKYNVGDNKEETFFVEHNDCLNDYDIELINELSVDKIMEN